MSETPAADPYALDYPPEPIDLSEHAEVSDRSWKFPPEAAKAPDE